jgi:hypothetical protein
MAHSLDIGLDVDGVVYPFIRVIADYASKVLGRPCSAEPETWDWYERQWGISSDEFWDLCRRGVSDGVLFTVGEPLPGALEATKQLAASGHRLHFLTSRSITGVSTSLARELTSNWLEDWAFPVDSLTITEDKACRATDVFLDDSPHVYDALVAAGHPRPILWSHPGTLSHPAERVLTWGEFLEIVRAESESDREVRRPT